MCILKNSAILIPDINSEIILICMHQDSCIRGFTEALYIKQNTEITVKKRINRDNVHETHNRILHNRENE